MNNKTEEYQGRKQITFDLNQKDLARNYPRSKITVNPKFYKKAYKDIRLFMEENGFEHRQYSVYASTKNLTAYDVAGLMEQLARKMPWLYSCVNEIDVTDIGEQHSIKEILGAFTQQKDISIVKVQIEMPEEKGDTMADWKRAIEKEKVDNPMERAETKECVQREQTDR